MIFRKASRKLTVIQGPAKRHLAPLDAQETEPKGQLRVDVSTLVPPESGH